MKRVLDVSNLRTFVAIADGGTFAAAAERVGLSVPAVSHQIRRLENLVGGALFRREGRRQVFSDLGYRLLSHARRIVQLNDAALENLISAPLEGIIRFGTVQDIADSIFPAVLQDFSKAHPLVRLDVRVERSVPVVEAVRRGQLDAAIAPTISSATVNDPPVIPIRSYPMKWLSSPDVTRTPEEPVPLVLFEAPCRFRDAALAALGAAGREWRIAYTSPSLFGLRAAVQAGLGVTVRTPLLHDSQLVDMREALRLPDLPYVEFSAYKAAPDIGPAAERLLQIIHHTMTTHGFTGGSPASPERG